MKRSRQRTEPASQPARGPRARLSKLSLRFWLVLAAGPGSMTCTGTMTIALQQMYSPAEILQNWPLIYGGGVPGSRVLINVKWFTVVCGQAGVVFFLNCLILLVPASLVILSS